MKNKATTADQNFFTKASLIFNWIKPHGFLQFMYFSAIYRNAFTPSKEMKYYKILAAVLVLEKFLKGLG